MIVTGFRKYKLCCHWCLPLICEHVAAFLVLTVQQNQFLIKSDMRCKPCICRKMSSVSTVVKLLFKAVKIKHHLHAPLLTIHPVVMVRTLCSCSRVYFLIKFVKLMDILSCSNFVTVNPHAADLFFFTACSSDLFSRPLGFLLSISLSCTCSLVKSWLDTQFTAHVREVTVVPENSTWGIITYLM